MPFVLALDGKRARAAERRGPSADHEWRSRDGSRSAGRGARGRCDGRSLWPCLVEGVARQCRARPHHRGAEAKSRQDQPNFRRVGRRPYLPAPAAGGTEDRQEGFLYVAAAPLVTRAATSSLTGMESSLPGVLNNVRIRSACFGLKCASTEASNFFTSTGIPSARRFRCPIGNST